MTGFLTYFVLHSSLFIFLLLAVNGNNHVLKRSLRSKPVNVIGPSGIQCHASKMFYATTTKGLEAVLADEIRVLNDVSNVKVLNCGVSFDGSARTGFEALMWLRTSLRLMEQISCASNVLTKDNLVSYCNSVDWKAVIDPSFSIKCDSIIGQSTGDLSHTHFSALTVKNAIVDQFRAETGSRPSVDLEHPDVSILLYLHRGDATLYKVWSGEVSMHKRGYREVIHRAALRETSAAGIVRLSKWTLEGDGPLCDPMCGSGTLAIEAALMTTDTAPGLLRYKMDDLGDVGRPSQSLPRSVLLDTEASQELWATVWDDAQKRDKRLEYVSEGRPIVASVNDLHPGAIELAIKSAAAANVHKLISFSCRDAELFEPKSCRFILTNPPWDLRLEGAADSWRKLGSLSRRLFSPQGGMLWALSGNPAVVREIGLKPTKSVPISGPTADMRLLCYDIAASK